MCTCVSIVKPSSKLTKDELQNFKNQKQEKSVQIMKAVDVYKGQYCIQFYLIKLRTTFQQCLNREIWRWDHILLA